MTTATTTTETTSTTPPAATTTAAPAATSTSWMDGLSPELKDFVTTKDFKEPGAIVQSYRDLEKTMGVPKERLLKLPEKADAPEWNDIYGKLGRPEKADGYKIPLPQGDKGEFAKVAAPWFHEAGLSQRQAEKLATRWNEYATAQQQQAAKGSAETAKAAEGELRQKWGAAFDQNLALADHAAEKLGIDDATALGLKQAMGATKAVEFLHSLASKIGEADFTTGSGPRGFGNKMTPDQANARIQSLKQDEEFGRKLSIGNVDAVKEWTDLHMMANPDSMASA
jgi:hypothetical protein